MKDVIAVAEKVREIQRPLLEKVDKAVMAKVAKVANAIDIGNKYRWAISNDDIDIAGDLGQTGVKKYWRCIGQIQAKINWLNKDWIPILGVFVKHSWKMHKNEKITKNMMIRRDIDLE